MKCHLDTMLHCNISICKLTEQYGSLPAFIEVTENIT